MKSFKAFLTESSVASFDVTKMDIEDLIDCERNGGHVVSKAEMKLYLDCKYEGYKSGKHCYIVFMKDDNNEGFYLTRMYLSLGKEGKVIAEPSGAPFFENEYEDLTRAKYNMG